MDNTPLTSLNQDWMEEHENREGQLAVDVFQTEDDIVLKAPIAGVKSEDLEISITDEIISIKGERKEVEETAKENYFATECYWGSFSRSYILPIAVDAEKATAGLKNGILTLRIPKLEKSKTKTIEIKTEE